MNPQVVTDSQTFLNEYGQDNLLVLYESENILNNKQANQIVLQKLSVAGFYVQRVFNCPLLRHLPTSNKELSLNRSLFYTKAIGRSHGVPCIHGLYPTKELEEVFTPLKLIIRTLKPSAIICLGALPLWVLTGYKSISDYRGSEEVFIHDEHAYPVLATHSPLSILAQIDFHIEMEADFKRLARNLLNNWGKNTFTFTISETYKQACDLLKFLKARKRLICDIETQARAQITCIGFGYDKHSAIVIPFVSKNYPLGYYTPDEELDLVHQIRTILTSTDLEIGGQNFIYDCQFMARMWGIYPTITHDTFIAQSVLYPNQPRDLAYLSSMYCQHYTYWKNELNEWKTLAAPDSTLFKYNATDCARTYEVLSVLLDKLESKKLIDLYTAQMRHANLTLRINMRGVRKNTNIINTLLQELKTRVKEEETYLMEVIPQWTAGTVDAQGKRKGAWWNSSQKISELCYNIFKIPPVLNKKTHKPTVGKEAVPKIIKHEPLLKPILERILTIHSLENSINVVQMGYDPVDGRIHTSFTPCGANTFRYTSSEDPFGYGTNLQNISSGVDG